MAQFPDRESNDISVPPGWQILVWDKTSGNVNVHVGPTKKSLSDNEVTVIFDEDTREYVVTAQHQAMMPFIRAKRNQYIRLVNPTTNGNPPEGKGEKPAVDLLEGETLNIQGPTAFPLWPGQYAEVVDGHHLKNNQYLVVRVNDEDSSRKSLESAVVRTVDVSETEEEIISDHPRSSVITQSDLSTGALLVIRGTDVRFFIPPTGMEVLVDEDKNYLREAVTLESMEYCVLISQSGIKRYVKGPDVVFPSPFENFEKDRSGTRKFRAIELSPQSGIYVKVIAGYYVSDTDAPVKAGTELFIVGKDQQFYFPRSEHSIVSYGGKHKVHHAVAIPAGNARYVLDRETGDTRTAKGPAMELLDPRKEVFIRRMLSDRQADLYYPGNAQVKTLNAALRQASTGGVLDEGSLMEKVDELASTYQTVKSSSPKLGSDLRQTSSKGIKDDVMYTSLSSLGRSTMAEPYIYGDIGSEKVSDTVAADKVDRGSQFTEPRTITIDAKYDGAVKIQPWTGYAIKVVDTQGLCRIVEGPDTVLLAYDEDLEVLNLSRGKPKNTDNLLSTVYLKVRHNNVSDIISVTTKDMVQARIKVSYMVNFIAKEEEDKLKWFDVNNPVKYLCDHLRTQIRDKVLTMTASELQRAYISMMEGIVMGEDGEGTSFAENGMMVYGVETLGFEFDDSDVQHSLVNHNREISRRKLQLEKDQELNVIDELTEKITRLRLDRETMSKLNELEKTRTVEVAIHELNMKDNDEKKLEQESLKEVEAIRQFIRTFAEEQQVFRDGLERKAITEDVRERSEIEVRAVLERAKAAQPELIAAIQSMADSGALQAVVDNLAPLSVVRQTSISGILSELLEDSGALGSKLLENFQDRSRT